MRAATSPGVEPVEPTSAAAPPVLDRSASERIEPGLLDTLLADPRTQVLELRGSSAPIGSGAEGPRLSLRAPLSHDTADVALFLGRDEQGRGWLALALEEEPAQPPEQDKPAAGPGERPDPPQAAPQSWSGLRDVGALLGARDVDAYMTASGLLNWHRTHRFCPRCGSPTAVASAGWVRRCEQDGSEHYPRTDPAVIMAVIDSQDRLLLARNAAWPPGRRSVLAGFVEPGERLEAAVAREVFEEVGVHVSEVTYSDSQPWPFPASLMLGFSARVDSASAAQITVDEEEIAEADWYTRERVAVEVADGTLGLPGRLSIARRLLETWFGSEITPPVEVAFHRPS